MASFDFLENDTDPSSSNPLDSVRYACTWFLITFFGVKIKKLRMNVAKA